MKLKFTDLTKLVIERELLENVHTPLSVLLKKKDIFAYVDAVFLHDLLILISN